MINKESNILKELLNHAHLVNPLHSLVRTGKSIWDAPKGKLRLAQDDKTNMALWNALYVAAPALALGYVLNNAANQKHEAEVEDKLDDQLIDKLQATRPRLVSDPNLGDVSSFTDLPKNELNRIEDIRSKLPKKASEGADLGDTVKDSVYELIANSLKGSIPLAAAALATYGGVAWSNHNNKERIKARLTARRNQVRNIQALIDNKMLEDKGLIKNSSIDKQAEERPSKRGGSSTGALEGMVTPALLLYYLMSTLVGAGAYKLTKDRDKNVRNLEYLKKIQLGSNTLQDAPQLSVLDLPVDHSKLVELPGDKSSSGEQTKPKARRITTSGGKIDPANIITEVKKKDALF